MRATTTLLSATLPVPRTMLRGWRRCLAIASVLLTLGSAASNAGATVTLPQALGPAAGTLAFEPNHGQSAEPVDYLVRGLGYSLFLADGDATFVFAKNTDRVDSCQLRLRFDGSRRNAVAQGESLQAGRSNYLSLDDSRPAIRDVQRFGRVRYSGLYPGIDLVYYGNQGELEYDLELAPGTDHIPTLALEGATDVRLAENGDLDIEVCGRHVAFRAPVAFQDIDGQRQRVAARYTVLPDHRATFALGAYDRSRPLVIDPVFAYSSCLSGSGDEYAFDLALGAGGETYVVGYTMSANFPTRGPIHGHGGGAEAFVTKLNAAGTDILYSTFIGGNAESQIAYGVAVNGAGEVFISGATDVPPSFSQAFLIKLNAAGNGVAFSSVFGGSSYDGASEVALDSAGNPVVVGYTWSSDFPVLNALQGSAGGGGDAFVRRYSSTGTLLSSTYLGGANEQRANSVAVGPGDAIYIAGRTDVSDASGDAFAARLNAAASSITYSKRFGGTGTDIAEDIVVDGGSRAHIVGRTNAANFPTVNAVQPSHGGGYDGFLAVLDSAGNTLSSSYLGSSNDELVEGVALGPGGEVYVTGSRPGTGGEGDVFLLKLGANFISVVFSTFIPTGWGDAGTAVRVDGSGAAYIVGYTRAGQYFATTPGAFQSCPNGSTDVIALKIIDGQAQLSISDTSVVEGNSGSTSASFTVSLSAPALTTTTFSYATANGSATAPGDYTAASQSGVAIPAGSTSVTITVPVAGDTLDEPDETFSVSISNVVGAAVADGTAVAAITDDDAAPGVSISDCSLTEGTGGTASCIFTVALTAPSAHTVSVNYTSADSSAIASADYTPVSGTLTFSPSQTSQTIAVSVVGDGMDENDESFTVTLSGALNASPGDSQGVGTIADDDAPPTVSIGSCTTAEGTGGNALCVMTVSLTAPSGLPINVNYAATDGSATASTDYVAGSGTLSFSPGEFNKTLSYVIITDGLDEPDETFIVTLSGPSNVVLGTAQATGTISDDDPTPTLTVSGCSVAEGHSGSAACTFTIGLNVPSGLTVTTNYTTADGTATAAVDYVAASGTITFSPTETSKTVTISVVGDTLNEASESFTLNLSGTTNTTNTSASATGTIVNDDTANGQLRMTECTADISELVPQIQLTVERVNGSGGPVSVNYSTSNGTATAGADYTAASGTLNWPAGDVGARTITISLINNVAVENREFFNVALSTPGGGASLLTPTTTRVWIMDHPDQLFDDGFGGVSPCP
ncbi:Calx-beta domain-containing protein [Tahibacter amnicola]|uniref:Calx-beta domain-containing protein n=1 Tax=Tahibacter amnicola TaxID=2976241 RepID=A0ABY6BAT3_9GAMM|nr:Calx-beta domain-containing protein [Tahibacter amnicola]UXI66974.1 hypothetical protein N4264_19800 [Tahibacter amnicola]